jgi:hypothetical protein
MIAHERRRRLASKTAMILLVLLALMGVVMVAGQPASAHAAHPAVWIGSPLQGRWPTAAGCAGASYPSANCSLPTAHHSFSYGDPYPGDFAVDLQGVPANRVVRLYAAPSNTSLNNQIRARVERVVPACASGRIADGGHAVVVGIYQNSTKIGTVKYVHVNPTVTAGQWINRWGTQIGTVGSYQSNSCWTGVHLHLEMTNWHHYACYNRGWSPGQQVNATNFIGFLGGDFARAPRRACP